MKKKGSLAQKSLRFRSCSARVGYCGAHGTVGPWRAWRLLVRITAAAPLSLLPRRLCFRGAPGCSSFEALWLHPGARPKVVPSAALSSWEPVACVSPHGGEEGSFGEQLEKLNRHQNLDGNGIQGSFLAPCTKKEDGRRCGASENPGVCVPSPRSPALL